MSISSKSTVNAIKARLRRRLISARKVAEEYMRMRYGLRKLTVPKIVWMTKDHPLASVIDGAFALATPNFEICLRVELLEFPWHFVEELLLHKMAHIAMWHVDNNTHNLEWKKCALCIGATGATS